MMCKLNMASCLALMLAAATAQAQSAAEIMDKADRANRPHDRNRPHADGAERCHASSVLKRELVWYFRNEEGKRTSLMKFTGLSQYAQRRHPGDRGSRAAQRDLALPA
ncbi:hypothetical protein LP420_39365 [Massilia sp. B-10]|nr:hypothetical protein LP420_39365 [Massilia sp. B-10]